MKWIVAPLVWVAALVVAFAVLWRLWRGKNVVLRGRFSPRFARMVVMLLILLGVGIEKAQAEDRAESEPVGTARSDERLPEIVTEEIVTRWRHRGETFVGWAFTKWMFVDLESTVPEAKARLLDRIEADARFLPGRFRNIFTAHIEALKQDKPVPVATCPEMIDALDELEAAGLFDPWIAGYLWQRSSQLDKPAQRGQMAELYGRLHRHARIADTLTRAKASVGPIPVSSRPWMSKAGPRPWERRNERLARTAILAAAKELYPTTDAGTWDDDAKVRLVVAAGSPTVTLRRSGNAQVCEPGDLFEFRRLDAVDTPSGDKPAVLRHVWLGPVELPAGRSVTVWDLPGFLSADAKEKLQKSVAAALSGDEQAAEQLELVLPLSHRAVRAAVAEKSGAPGAARLRMILTLFDDTLVRLTPQPVDPRGWYRPNEPRLNSPEYGPEGFGPGSPYGPGAPPGYRRERLPID